MPAPVPTVIKQLRGTDQPCRVLEHEPDPPGEVAPEAPPELSPSQRELWAQIVRAAAPHLLRACDAGVLLQYVVARDLFAKAAQEVNEQGYITTHKGRKYVSAAVHVMNSQSIIMRQAEQELGFTPAARSRINTLADTVSRGMGGPSEGHWQQLAMGY